jgi:hypothetical protein
LKNFTFLALGVAIRRAGCVRGVVGHVSFSPSPAPACPPYRRRRTPGPGAERRRDAAQAGALHHWCRRRREPHAEQPHPAAASGAGARVVAVVAAVRAPSRHPRRRAVCSGTCLGLGTRGLRTCDQQRAYQIRPECSLVFARLVSLSALRQGDILGVLSI